MKVFLIFLFLISFAFSNNIQTIDDRNFSLRYHTFNWDTNWKKHSIDYNELVSGGPSRDGIPPIDKPKFVSINQAKTWIKDNEPLIFVKIHNKTKAYPLQVLIWHEIVNDKLSDKKISITFCPLCNASIVFNRTIDGKVYDFGTSGLLRNSDLVMYDRQTQSLWQQFTGTSIVGDMTGIKLQEINSSILSFKDIYKRFPRTQILSKATGHNRDYGRNPYSGYDDINQSPFMLKLPTDPRLKPMRRVATVSIKGKDKAYSYKILRNKKVINDNFEDKKLTLFYKDKIASALDKSEISQSKDIGSVLVYNRVINNKVLDFYYKKGYFDKQTNSQWNIFGEAIKGELKGSKLTPIIHGSHFWFAWAIFKPETIIYK